MQCNRLVFSPLLFCLPPVMNICPSLQSSVLLQVSFNHTHYSTFSSFHFLFFYILRHFPIIADFQKSIHIVLHETSLLRSASRCYFRLWPAIISKCREEGISLGRAPLRLETRNSSVLRRSFSRGKTGKNAGGSQFMGQPCFLPISSMQFPFPLRVVPASLSSLYSLSLPSRPFHFLSASGQYINEYLCLAKKMRKETKN